jgi:hypothetical protein
MADGSTLEILKCLFICRYIKIFFITIHQNIQKLKKIKLKLKHGLTHNSIK